MTHLRLALSLQLLTPPSFPLSSTVTLIEIKQSNTPSHRTIPRSLGPGRWISLSCFGEGTEGMAPCIPSLCWCLRHVRHPPPQTLATYNIGAINIEGRPLQCIQVHHLHELPPLYLVLCVCSFLLVSLVSSSLSSVVGSFGLCLLLDVTKLLSVLFFI